jgi:hypothetical protein
MGRSHVVGPERAPYTEQPRRERRDGRPIAAVAVMLLALVALAFVLVAAGPAAASETTPLSAAAATPLSAMPAAPDPAALQAIDDLAASLRSWRASAPSTVGYDRPTAAENDVVIYNRANLYWEIHVKLDSGDATSYEIGQQYARAMLRADPEWTTKVYKYILGAECVLWLKYSTLRDRALALKKTVSPEVRDCIAGMGSVVTSYSRGWVNENDCWILNLFPDVARQTSCSALGAWGTMTPDRSPIVGRNLDWSDDDLLPTLNAITVFHNGSKSFCSLGYLGLFNVISGFNKSGLYGAILDAGTGQDYPSITTQHSYPMDLRTALETTHTIKDAAAVMAQNPYCFNHQILLADKVRVGVLENDLTSTGPWARKVRVDDTPLDPSIPKWTWKDSVCAVNSFLAKGNNVGAFACESNTDRWTRYRAQMQTVSKLTVPKMKTCLSYGGPDWHNWPYNYQTTMMMVFQPKDGHLEIFMKPRSGGLPKDPTWQSFDVDWGQAAFADRWIKTWPAPESWAVTGAKVKAVPGGGAVAAAQLSRKEGADAAVAVVRWRADGRVLWSKLIDPAGDADAWLAGLAATHDAVVVGATKKSDAGSCWLIRKYQAGGAGGWTRCGDVDGRIDVLGGVAVTSDGGVIAGGGKSTSVVAGGSGPASDWCVNKYSAAGKPQWQRILASEDASWTEAITAVERFAGSVVVAGTWAGHGQPFGDSLSVARLSSDGTVRWQQQLSPEGLTAPVPTGLAVNESGIAVAGDESVQAGGVISGGRCAYRLDPDTGSEVWQYGVLPGAAGEATSFHDIAIDDYGNVTATGDSVEVATGSELGIVSWFGPAGESVSRTIGSGDAGGKAVAVEAGNYGVAYISATLSPKDGNQAMETMCCLPDGVVRWVTSNDFPACAAFDTAVRDVDVYTVGGTATGLVLGKYDTTTAPLVGMPTD